MREGLNNNKPVRAADADGRGKKHIEDLHLMTDKPSLYVINVFDIEKDNQYIEQVKDFAKKDNSQYVVISGDIESEIAQMAPEERKTYYKEMGIEESGLEKVDPRDVSPVRINHLFHGWPARNKGMDHPAGDKSAAGGRGNPFRFRTRLYLCRDLQLQRPHCHRF